MSQLEDLLAFQIRAHKLPRPEREARLIPERRFRWDFAWLEQRIAVEIQGAVWIKGAHSTGRGITRDCEKANLAALAGFRTLFLTGDMVKSGEAIETLRAIL